MATVTKTFTENSFSSYKSTWTVTFTGNNVTVTGSTFTVPLIAPVAKYTYSGKTQAEASLEYYVYINGTKLNYEQEYWFEMASWASGASKTLPRWAKGSENIPTQNTSTYFNSSNKTSRSVSLQYQAQSFWGWSRKAVDSMENMINYLSAFNIFSPALSIILNAPPIVDVGTPTYEAPQYAGLGAYSVPVNSAIAQYGGDISAIKLTIGNDSVTKTYAEPSVADQTLSLIPSAAGTYSPILTVIDSRGQETNITLPQIIVNAYTAPSIDFSVQRTDGVGVPADEGEYALATARISYTDAIAKLTRPVVSVADESGSVIASAATWYKTWSPDVGVSNPVDWTDYNPESPTHLYAIIAATGGPFSPNESYSISVTPMDNMGGTAQTIIQILSTAFFTLDFLAGGHGVAFGQPAKREGLYFGMPTFWKRPNDPEAALALVDFFHPVGSYYETSDTSFDPNIQWGGRWVLETEGQVHVSAGTNYPVAGAPTDTSDGGEESHLLTAAESGMPSHNHTQNAHYHSGLHSGSLTGTAVKGGTDYCAAGGRSGVGSHSSATATIYTSNATAVNQAAAAKNASSAHNNMQPYINVNRWHRTA